MSCSPNNLRLQWDIQKLFSFLGTNALCFLASTLTVSHSNILEKQLCSMSDGERGMSRSNPFGNGLSLRCQLVTSRHIWMQGCSSFGRSLWWHAYRREYNKGNNGVFFKCCISHHYTSTLNHAKNRYYTKSVACTPISLFVLRTEELATEYWTVNLKSFCHPFPRVLT